jgi:cell division protein FtsQ
LLALGGLVLVVLVGVAVGGRALLLHSGRFQVTNVEVLGVAPSNPGDAGEDGGLDPARVRAAAGIRSGVPLLAVDLAAVQRRVAAIPEVATVRASRGWPSTVRLTVTERTPVAEAVSPNGLLWVDSTGKAYREAPLDAPPLPRLATVTVAPGDPATVAGLAVLASLTPSLREKLQVVEASGPAAVTLRLAGGKQVRWGSPERSDRKAAVLGVLMSQRGSVYDVSAPDLPTIRR